MAQKSARTLVLKWVVWVQSHPCHRYERPWCSSSIDASHNSEIALDLGAIPGGRSKPYGPSGLDHLTQSVPVSTK